MKLTMEDKITEFLKFSHFSKLPRSLFVKNASVRKS